MLQKAGRGREGGGGGGGGGGEGEGEGRGSIVFQAHMFPGRRAGMSEYHLASGINYTNTYKCIIIHGGP